MRGGRPLIVDAQIHTWQEETPERPWVAGPHDHGDKAFLPDDVLREMDRAGVDAAVLVPSRLDGGDPAQAIAAARQWPDRIAVMVRIPLSTGTDFLVELERLWADPAVLAGRAMFSRESANVLAEGGADWLFDAASRMGLPLLASCPGRQHLIGSVAQRHPDVKITIDHLGLATKLRDDEIREPIEELVKLARYPNISVKASCLPSYVTDPFPFASLFPYIRQVVEAFGPERVFWGSDLTRLRCDYTELTSMFLEKLGFLSERDLELIMGEALCAWFGWTVPTRGKE